MFARRFLCFNKHSTEIYSQARLTLGLSISATPSKHELRGIYFTLAKECHPDISQVGKLNPARFIAISEAYSLLCEEIAHPGDVYEVFEQNQSDQSKLNSAEHLWARMFCSSAELEVGVNKDVVGGIKQAGELCSGGLDKGGLWEFVHRFNGALKADSYSAVILPTHEPSQSKPASRKKLSK